MTRHPASPRILVLGGTTHRNRGDLAMQAGLADWLHATCPDAAVDFLSANPETSARHIRADRHLTSPDALLATAWTRETATSTTQRKAAIRRGRRFVRRRARAFRGDPEGGEAMAAFFATLDAASAVVVPGSGSMNSLWWHDWLYPKAFTVLAAARAGKPVFMSSQGVGPEFSHPLDAKVAAEMFSSCQRVGVRDGDASAAILDRLGIGRETVVTTGDDALLFKGDDTGAAITAELATLPTGRRRVGLNLRDSSSYGHKYPKLDPERIAAQLDATGARHDLHFVFIPVSYDAQDDDRSAARAIVEKMAAPERANVVEREWDAGQIRALAGAMDLAVGISYHFLLFSLHAGVPTLGLYQNPYYRQKSTGLFGLYSCPDYAVDLGATGGEFSAAFDRMLADADTLAPQLAARGAALEGRFDSSRTRLAEGLRRAMEED